MSTGKFKVAIIGAGPSGGILGAFLQRKNVEVIIVDIWKSHMEAIRRYGLQIFGASTLTVHFDSDHSKLSVSELKNSDVNLVFLCVKTPFLKQVVDDLTKVISDDTLVVCHTNGAGPEDIIVEAFGPKRSFRNVINYAGNILKPGIIDMTFFNPPNYVGSVTKESEDQARAIAELMSCPGFETEYHDNIQTAVWKKVILNAALAPVCAITGQTMSEAMDFENTNKLASAIIKEGILVTNAIGVEFGPDFHDICLGYLKKAGHHKPSMLIDIENRSPTEIDYLNGKIVEIAKQYNIPVPVNEATTTYVKALETKY